MLNKASYKIGIFYGLDDDNHARLYSLKLMNKYEQSEDIFFLDCGSIKKKLNIIKKLCGLAIVNFGVHSYEISSPEVIELEACEKSIVNILGNYLKENKIIDRLAIISPDLWGLTECPQNYGVIEIFNSRNSLQKFENVISKTLEFCKKI